MRESGKGERKGTSRSSSWSSKQPSCLKAKADIDASRVKGERGGSNRETVEERNEGRRTSRLNPHLQGREGVQVPRDQFSFALWGLSRRETRALLACSDRQERRRVWSSDMSLRERMAERPKTWSSS
eukprot:445574-Hanusia_phi.AAC.1